MFKPSQLSVRALLISCIVALGCSATVNAQSRAPAEAATALLQALLTLSKNSEWTLSGETALQFDTFHPQGLHKVNELYFMSSVEIIARTQAQASEPGGRTVGEGVGHLFTFNSAGELHHDLPLGEDSIYHPGGIDFDGESLWIPVAEYRPDSAAIIYRVNPNNYSVEEQMRVDDHIGAVIVDRASKRLYGYSWGARKIYAWDLDDAMNPIAGSRVVSVNPAYYVDYQDCQSIAPAFALCSGLSSYRNPLGQSIALGGVELVDLAQLRPRLQFPVNLYSDGERTAVMTQNPMYVELTSQGLMFMFVPEDSSSRAYFYLAE